MARLRDLPPVILKEGPFGFLRRLWLQINEDNLLTWAAALAYSWLFAIFPFFLFLLTLLPYLPENWKHTAQREIAFAVDQLPREAANTIRSNVRQVLENKASSISVLSVLLTLWAAAGGMNMTMAALDKAYDVTRARPFYKQRPLSVALTLIVTVLILAVLILIPIGSIVTSFATSWAARHAPESMQQFLPFLLLWQVARFALGILLMLATVSILYHFGPNVRQHWRLLSPGAIFTVLVWLGLGAVFRVYVDKFGKYDQTYGAVGGVVILLLFFYIDAAVLLIGAEINSEVDFVCLGLEPGATDFTGTPWAHLKPAEPKPPAPDTAPPADDRAATPTESQTTP